MNPFSNLADIKEKGVNDLSLLSDPNSQEDFPTVVLALEVAAQAVGPPPPSKPNPRYGHEDGDEDYHKGHM